MMTPRTYQDAFRLAEELIQRQDVAVYDVAADCGQIVGNVRHMAWFAKAVVNWIIASTNEYAHLEYLDP